jgi:hypothetical protein
MLVGSTQQFTAVDDQNRQRIDATWTVSNTTLATITPDTSPILTALAVGQVTLTADVQGVSAQVQVNILSGTSLPIGITQWQAPLITGFNCTTLVQALPTIGGNPDLYCIATDNNGDIAVQALTTDGQQLWQRTISNAYLDAATADAYGGLLLDYTTNFQVVPTLMLRVDLDGLTGSTAWQTAFTNGGFENAAIRSDGTIVSVQSTFQGAATPFFGYENFSTSLVLLNGRSGQPIMNLALPPTVQTLVNKTCPQLNYTSSNSTSTSSPIVDTDGTVRLLLAYGTTTITDSCISQDDQQYAGTTTLSLFTVYLDGSTSTQTIQSRSNNDFAPDLAPGVVIPDGQGGALASWTDYLNSCNFTVSHATSQGITTYTLPLNPSCDTIGTQTMVLGENGTAFATNGLNLVSFNVNSGQVVWTYQAQSETTFAITAATVGDGLAGISTDQNGVKTVITFDPSGNPNSNTTAATYLDYSWQGAWNAILNGAASGYSLPPELIAGSSYAMLGGSQSANGMAVDQVLTIQPQGSAKQLPDTGPFFGNINMVEFRTDKTPDYIFQNYLQTFAAAARNPGDAQPFRNNEFFFTNSPNNPGYTNPDAINVTGSNQVLDITLRGIARLGQGAFSVMTERFDPVNHVISTVTLQGHPLAGWRYWRVYSVGTNDVVIETGAYDAPGPGTANFVGYFLGQDTISKSWLEFLEYMRSQPDLNASPGTLPMIDVGGQGTLVPVQNLLNGIWDTSGFYRDYILNNVCLAPPGALTCH